MSLFRHSSSSQAITSQNEHENVVYMLTDEHRKPNIIRSSGTKLPKTQPQQMLELNSHKSMDFFKTESAIESIDLSASTDISSPDNIISTLCENMEGFDDDQLQIPSSNLQSVMVSSEDLHNFQQQLGIEPKIENEQNDFPEDSLMEASIQTPDGNYMILIKGNEIVSAHEMNALDNFNFPESDQVAASASESLNGNDSLQTETETEQNGEADNTSESQVGGPYSLYQLPNGDTILVQVGLDESHQMILNENQEVIQVLPSLQPQSISQVQIPHFVKGNKPRKRSNTEHHVKCPNPPKKTYSNTKKTKTNSSSKLMQPLGTIGTPGNSISIANFYQHSDPSSDAISSNLSLTQEETRISDQIPIVELKAKPFRFDIPEAEANGYHDDDNFLSLVIENFQTQMDAHSETADKKPDVSVLPRPHSTGLVNVNVTNKREGFELVIPTQQCPKCSFKAVDKKSLTQHVLRFHNEDLPFTCSICGHKFTYDFQLASHFKIHHGQEQSISCKSCGQQFQMESALNIHRRSCSPKMDLKIKNEVVKSEDVEDIQIDEKLHLVENNKSSTRRKQTVYSRGKEFPCEDTACYKWFGDKFALMRHQINVHVTKPPFSCSILECDKSFDSKEALLSHIASHEDGIARPFECQRCQKGFKMESHLIGHMRAHIQRDSTENNTSREQDLANHPEKLMQLVKISYRNKTKDSDAGIKEAFCDVCDDIFPNILALDTHKIHSGHGNSSVSLISSKSDAKSSEVGVSTHADNGTTVSEDRNLVAFDSITDWRRHVESQSQKASSTPTPLLIGGRPFRNFADVQNDFKALSTKILEAGKDNTVENQIRTEEYNDVSIKDSADSIPTKDSLQQPSADAVKKAQVIIRTKKIEKKIAKVNTHPSEELILQHADDLPLEISNLADDTDQQTLSNDSISSIVNHMSSRMSTRDGVKPAKVELPKTVGHVLVKKQKPIPQGPRELRSRIVKSNEATSQASQITSDKINNKIDDKPRQKQTLADESNSATMMDTSKVGKTFVSIFQKVKKLHEKQPAPLKASSDTQTRSLRSKMRKN